MKKSVFACGAQVPAMLSLFLASLPLAAEAQVTTTNLGHAIVDQELHAGVLAFTVDEAKAGGVDLNGDGDASDHVYHVRNLATDETTNLGLAASISDPRMEVVGGRVIFTVFEFLQGTTDLTGDGDAVDLVLHIHDVASGTTLNTGLSLYLSHFRAGADWIAAFVREFDQGFTDLNGDGDTSDRVLHAVDAATGVATNLQLAPAQFTWALDTVFVDDDVIGFLVGEADQGFTDLNGDGDTFDRVQHVHHASTGTTTNLGLASARELVVNEGYVAFNVSEGEQGIVDLNGDGDATDEVLYVYDVAEGELSSSQFAISDSSVYANNIDIDEGRIAFRVSEARHFGQDLNGDGDVLDSVVHVMDLPVSSATNLGIASFDVRLAGNIVVTRVGENAQGAGDLNGDGDAFDRVLHAHDLVAGTTQSLELHVRADEAGYDLWGSLVACRVRESGQGSADLNGDHDVADDVLFVHDLNTGVTINVERAAGYFELIGPQVVLHVREDLQDADLNGDGDQDDTVIELYDSGTGTLVTLGLAIYDESSQFTFGDAPFHADRAHVSFAVSEAGQGGTDLNADTDTDDDVLHVAKHEFANGFAANGVTLSLGTGGAQELDIEAGTASAADLYWILGSVSGTSPGLPGTPAIPLNPDDYFSATLAAPEAFIVGGLGFLDGDGAASATLSLPGGTLPGLAGLIVHHAAVAFDVDTASLSWASNAVGLALVP